MSPADSLREHEYLL